MAFQQGLSGLSAAAKNLDVIGHNIANANTTGMKAARAEFSELYANSMGSAGGLSAGIGVEVGAVAQQFMQGNLTVTGNTMDVAINGNGFFQLDLPSGQRAYTRDGSFKLTKDGGIVTNNGAALLGVTADVNGAIPNGGAIGPLQLPNGGEIAAEKSTKLDLRFNLDATATVPTGTPPDSLMPPIETYGTSAVGYNSLGTAIPISIYFTKTGTNAWDVYSSVDGGALASSGSMTFGNDGELTSSPTLSQLSLDEADGTPLLVDFNLERATQFGSTKFSVTKATTDGQPPGQLTSINIDDSGIVTGVYSNGKVVAAGQIQLAAFTNPQGLAPVGNNMWITTAASGLTPTATGSPATGNLGGVRSGALEDSNVDLTKELVNMMTAQRTYQANAQTIKTQDQVLNTVLNLR